MDKRMMTGLRVPKMELVQKNPEAAAAMAKALAPTNLGQQIDMSKKQSLFSLNQSKLNQMSDATKARLAENQNIMELFPDLSLAEQILVSSVLSPKDMYTETLIYRTKTQLFSANLQSKINDVVKEHIESHYNLGAELSTILREALVRVGSFVVAVIPEAALDQIINGQTYSAENHRQYVGQILDSTGFAVPQGILGPSVKENNRTALESFFAGNYSDVTDQSVKLPSSHFNDNATTKNFLEITDAYQLLKLPKLTEAISKQRMRRALANPIHSRRRYGLEAYGDIAGKPSANDPITSLSAQQFKDLVYKNQKPQNENVMVFPGEDTQDRYSIGRPLRMKIPTEAVIPVHPPGDPTKHRGYFILVDADGHWVTRSREGMTMEGLQGLLTQQQGGTNQGLTSLLNARTTQAFKDNKGTLQLDQMAQIYCSVVENDMISRMKNGLIGATMEISIDKEWERVMLARALQGKMTRVVFLPAELVTYYAFEYYDNGQGKSLLDQIKLLTSLRAILLFSGIMAQMKNAINVTKVGMTLDDKDPDPEKTVEMAVDDITRLRQNFFPLWVNSPNDLVDWIQRAGLMFEFEGHPGLPNTKFAFSNEPMQHTAPDLEIDNELRKQTFMTFGLTPEQVDQGFSPEFATTIIHNNAMFAKRISILSDTFCRSITEDVQTTLRNDQIARSDLMRVMKDAKEDFTKALTDDEKTKFSQRPDEFIYHFVNRVVDNIEIGLPKPDIGSVEDKLEAFNKQKEALTAVMETYFGEGVFSEAIDGEMASHAGDLQKFWTNYLLRRWISEEGFLPEVADIFRQDENGGAGNDALDLADQFKKDILLNSARFIERAKKFREAGNADLEAAGVGAGSGPAEPSETGGEGEGDEAAGGEDMDLSPEGGGDLEPPAEETPEGEEPGNEGPLREF